MVAVPGDDEPADGTRWVDPPGTGRTVELRVVLAPAAAVLVDPSGALAGPADTFAVVDAFRLAGGETVLLFAASSAPDPEKAAAVRRFRDDRRAQVSPGFDLSPETGPRTAAITVDEDGYRNVWDLGMS